MAANPPGSDEEEKSDEAGNAAAPDELRAA